ncbi:phage terminase large subunit [Thermosipho globiformans]|uniref:phage terminase large subunit n=1 Tax=Thermosipho globiformans TaxID=380685 RepID=UPI000F8CEB7D|nr:phage terminase large subunit [Thermosipho globiformans]
MTKSQMEMIARKLKNPEMFVKLLFGYDEIAEKQREILYMNGSTQVICAGRRFGKTNYVAGKIFYFATFNPRSHIIVGGPSLDQARIYYDLLEEALERSPLKGFVKKSKDSPFPTITLKNHSVITTRSTAYNGKYLRGRKVDLVVLTEAAFIKDSVYEQVITPMKLDAGAPVILESTPNGMNYFYEEYQRGLKGANRTVSLHATVYDNPFLDQEEIENAKAKTPEYVWRQEYLAEFVDDDSSFFPWKVLVEVFEDYKPAGYKEGHTYTIGVDLAKYKDYTVIVVLDTTEEPYKIAEFHRFNQIPYEEIIKLVNDIQIRYNGFVFLDATGVGDPVAERINACQPFVFSQKSKSELLHNLLLVMEQKRILLPSSNITLRDELRYFRRIKSGSGFKLEAQEGYHDDCVMALALAVYGATNKQEAKSFNLDIV